MKNDKEKSKKPKAKLTFGLNVIYEKSFKEAIDFAVKDGFGAIEVWASAPQFNWQKYASHERKAIASYASQNKIDLQLHGPEELSLFNFFPVLQLATLKCYRELIDFAKEIGAQTLTIHHGETTVITFQGGRKIPLFSQYPQILDSFKKNLTAVARYASGKVKLCLENANHFNDPLIKKIAAGLLKKKLLFLTWDIGKSYNKDGSVKEDEVNFFVDHLSSVKN
ncbi:MAG: hypothetical protein A2240_01310, partial [Candidatus Jacksonbacteria bacterium RIFOXYA2_FULL_43_12]